MAAEQRTGRLVGRRVVVTRAPEDVDALAAALAGEGAEVVALATLVRRPPSDPEAVVRAWSGVSGFDRVLCGSAAALGPFEGLPPPAGRVPVACVGAHTAARIEASPTLRARFEVAEVAEARRSEGLVETLVSSLGRGGRLEGRRFLFPRAPEGRLALLELLVARGAEVVGLETYRLGCAGPASASERAALDGADAFTFLSGRTLGCFFEVLGEAEARSRLAGAVIAMIGPVAAAEAERLGVRVDVVPSRAGVGELAEALAGRLARGP